MANQNQYKNFFLISTTLLLLATLWTFNSIFIEGNYNLLWWTLFVVYFLGNIESVYYHRFIAHKSWECPKWLEYIFLTIATGFHFLPAMFWAGGHRKHHNKNDGIGDIQGPTVSLKDNLNLVIGGREIEFRWMRDMVTNPLLVFQSTYYWYLMGAFAVVWSLIFGFDSYMFILLLQKLSQLMFLYVSHIGGARDNHWASMVLLNSEYLHKRHHDKAYNADFGGFDLWYHAIIKHFPKKV